MFTDRTFGPGVHWVMRNMLITFRQSYAAFGYGAVRRQTYEQQKTNWTWVRIVGCSLVYMVCSYKTESAIIIYNMYCIYRFTSSGYYTVSFGTEFLALHRVVLPSSSESSNSSSLYCHLNTHYFFIHRHSLISQKM